MSFVELMVVISMIVIIATIAMPGLLSSRITANEAATIQVLRAIVAAEATIRSRQTIETDAIGNGEGEYAYLAELGGQVLLRGTATYVDPPLLSAKLGLIRSGAANSSGYMFAMFLPGALGVGIPEDPAGGKADPSVLDSTLAERLWVAYAWPAEMGKSGRRAFVVNQSGDILATNNGEPGQGYSGRTAGPAFDAAFSAPGDISQRLAFQPGVLGQDGGRWLPLR